MEIHSFFMSKQIWAIMDIIMQLCLMDAHNWLIDIHIWVKDPCLNCEYVWLQWIMDIHNWIDKSGQVVSKIQVNNDWILYIQWRFFDIVG